MLGVESIKKMDIGTVLRLKDNANESPSFKRNKDYVVIGKKDNFNDEVGAQAAIVISETGREFFIYGLIYKFELKENEDMLFLKGLY